MVYEQSCKSEARAKLARNKSKVRLGGSTGGRLFLSVASAIRSASNQTVNRTYDLFEKLPDGEVLWRGSVSGLEAARRQLVALAGSNGNEYLLMHVLTSEIVGRCGERTSPER